MSGMLQSMAVLSAMTLINSASTVALARAAREGELLFMGAGMVGYATGAVLMVVMLRSQDVGVLGPVSSLLGMLLVVLGGQFLLGDGPLRPLQITGLLLAAMAIFLISGGAEAG